ncbi:MAG: substrate-binding domain-containing protein [Anaerolineae bacterium]
MALLVTAPALAGCGAAPTVAPTATPVYVVASSELSAVADAAESLTADPVSVSTDSYRGCLEKVSGGFAEAAVIWGPEPPASELYITELVGADGLAVVVHPSNQVGPLVAEDLRAIFSGEVNDWWHYGQSMGEVLPVVREPGSGTRLTFTELVMGEANPSSGSLVAASDGDVLDYVAANPAAIGYVAACTLREGVRALRVDGERPEPQKVRDGLYPLMAGVWLLTRPTVGGDSIWGLLASEPGQEMLQRYVAGPDVWR